MRVTVTYTGGLLVSGPPCTDPPPSVPTLVLTHGLPIAWTLRMLPAGFTGVLAPPPATPA